MLLFLKGFIIGIGKIIPGVSGAILAINFNIYEKAIDSVTNFFKDWNANLKFILLLGSGIILSVVLCSNLVIYFLNNYFFLTMMLFIGLILGGTYNFGKNIEYKNKLKDSLLVLLVMGIILIISVENIDNIYVMRDNFLDNIVFFIGGVIEIMASIIPGISGTALQMILGIYDKILIMISSIFNLSFVVENINLYLSYGFGMFLSLIVNLLLVNYFLKKHKRIANLVILGLSISSIVLLFGMNLVHGFTVLEFIEGIMLMVVGLLLACLLDK